MRVRNHRKLLSEVDPWDRSRSIVATVAVLTREVDPRLLEGKSPFDMLYV